MKRPSVTCLATLCLLSVSGSSLSNAATVLADADSSKVFSYKHAKGKGSQQGHQSLHSASQIALPDPMRFKSQRSTVSVGTAQTAQAQAQVVPGMGAAETFASRSSVADQGDTALQTMKLSSPLYGSYAKNYGSVSQPLAPGSGYGGFTANVDPTGFNFVNDRDTPTGPAGLGASIAPLSGPYTYGGGVGSVPYFNAYPANIRTAQTQTVNGLSPLGLSLGVTDSHYTLMGPKALGPYGVDTTARQPFVSGVGLVGTPLTGGNPGFVVPSFTANGAIPTTNPRTFGATPGAAAGVAQLTGRPVINGNVLNGVGLTYDPNLLTQRQMAMQGGLNRYNTPGLVRQLGVSYPSPTADRYSSVPSGSHFSLQVNTSPTAMERLGLQKNGHTGAAGSGAAAAAAPA